ncbi:MAG: hypothetical protein V1774_11570 [Candidatus Eisenbacteria bacterium]
MIAFRRTFCLPASWFALRVRPPGRRDFRPRRFCTRVLPSFLILLSALIFGAGCGNDDDPPEADLRAPAAIADLAVDSVGTTAIRLAWTATGDDSLTGRAYQYDLRRGHAPFGEEAWNTLTPIDGEPAPAAAGSHESFLVHMLAPATPYFFALKVLDEAGNSSALSNVAGDTTGGATWVVAPDGSGDFETIAAALAASADGDTLFLAAGTHSGPITIENRTIVIVGAGPGEARIVHGSTHPTADPALHIRHADVTLQSLSISQEYLQCGTAIDADSSTVVIVDCALIRCGLTADHCALALTGSTLWGIPLNDCDTIVQILRLTGGTARIENNILTQNPYGVLCSGSPVASFLCNDCWCSQGNYEGCADPTGTGGNISADPRFVEAGEDFHLREDSPCRAEANPQCGRSGAFGTAAGAAR